MSVRIYVYACINTCPLVRIRVHSQFQYIISENRQRYSPLFQKAKEFAKPVWNSQVSTFQTYTYAHAHELTHPHTHAHTHLQAHTYTHTHATIYISHRTCTQTRAVCLRYSVSRSMSVYIYNQLSKPQRTTLVERLESRET